MATDPDIKMNELITFVRQETTRHRRVARITWIIGVFLIIVVVTYMSGLLYMIRGILEPMTAATMIRQQVEVNLPPVLTGVEQSLKDKAPDLANWVNQYIRQTLPEIRKEGERQIDLVVDQSLPLMREEIRSVIHAYVIEHKDELQEIYASQKAPGFADAFVSNMVADIAMDVDRRLKDSSGVGLAYVETTTLNSLKDLDGDLKRLAAMDAKDMTRSERLQRRLIVCWLQIMNDQLQKKARGETEALTPSLVVQ